MTFTLLSAVDVAGGRVAQMVDGGAESAISRGAPLDAALAWQAEGAEWIHLVDIDAAFGRGSNAELLSAVVRDLDVNVQLSGGIRRVSQRPNVTCTSSSGCNRNGSGAAPLITVNCSAGLFVPLLQGLKNHAE